MRKVRVVRVLIQSVFLFFKNKIFFVFRGEGGTLLPPLTSVVKPTEVKNFLSEKKQKILYYFSYRILF